MFEEVIGHRRPKDTLTRQLDHDTLSHAYLFSGPEGIGKRRLAEDLAVNIIRSGLENKERKVTLQHADIKEIGLKDEMIKIKQIRELINETNILPLEGKFRVFIIDHADKMNDVAQNALLKTIEEPAEGNIFILITDRPTALLPTIRSRCQELPFHDLTQEEKKEILSLNHISGNPQDWTVSPGRMIRTLENPEHQQELEKYFDRFRKIYRGDSFEIFSLAEDLAKSSELSEECLNFFIRRLYNATVNSPEINQRILKTIDILFDLLGKLEYNINLRLQWESSLIDIFLEK